MVEWKILGRSRRFMVRSKASRAQTSRAQNRHWLIIASSDRTDPWRSRFEKDTRAKSLGFVKYLDAPVTLYSDFMEGRRAPYEAFLREVKKIVNSFWDGDKQEGVPPSQWKVVIAFTHGDAQGGVTMHPDADNEDLHWGVASQWWTPFFYVGVRRLHYHTCHVGRFMADPEKFPVIRKRLGGRSDEILTVTAWDYEIGQYDELGDECAPNDDYIFRGMPLCRAMDKAYSSTGLRGFNSIREIKVSITDRGPEVRQHLIPKAGR